MDIKTRTILNWPSLPRKWVKRIFLVVEKLNELKLITSIAKRLKVKPNMGIRIKLASVRKRQMEGIGLAISANLVLHQASFLKRLHFLKETK